MERSGTTLGEALPSSHTVLPPPLPHFPSLFSVFFLCTPMPTCTHAGTKAGVLRGESRTSALLSLPHSALAY